jgi:hypothetical protein
MRNSYNLKRGVFLSGVLILIMGGYNYVYLNSVPPIYAQIIPRVASNNSTTINSEPDATTTPYRGQQCALKFEIANDKKK